MNGKWLSMLVRLTQYLYHTRKDGLVFDKKQMLEVLPDHDLVAHSDASLGDVRFANGKKTRKSSYGYLIKYFGCTIVAKSSTITDVVWSSTKAEYLRPTITEMCVEMCRILKF